MDTKDTLTLTGMIFTLAVGTAGLIIGIINSRRTIYINSITSARIKYIQELRSTVSEYCGLFFRYKVLHEHHPGISNEKLEILRSIDKLKYQIMLYLNPEDPKWDKTIITLIENVRAKINENPEQEIKELVTITQFLLKLEWEGAKRESKRGSVNKKHRQGLSQRIYDEYIKHRQENQHK